jgi:ABC-type antimicrobial peptide transport system permease subunit
MVVLLVMGAQALNAGIRRTLSTSGSPANVMLLGAGSEESVQRSEVSEQAAGIAEASIPGVATVMDTRAVSPEIFHMAYLELPDGPRVRGMVRGVTSRALLTHREITVIEGSFPGPGELMAGRLAWKRFGVGPDVLRPGAEVLMEEIPFTVSGIFAAPGTVMESEVWMYLNDLRTVAQRETVSSIVVRLDDGEPDDVELFTRQRLDLELSAVGEEQYYERLSAFYAPVRAMTWTTAVLIATAAVFGGLNTLYAAFASRVREIATLQAIGFRRSAILVSLVQESMMTSLFGTLLGAILAGLLLSDRLVYLSTGTFQLTLGPETLFAGIVAGVILGLVGALPPAFRCLKPSLPQALRD